MCERGEEANGICNIWQEGSRAACICYANYLRRGACRFTFLLIAIGELMDWSVAGLAYCGRDDGWSS